MRKIKIFKILDDIVHWFIISCGMTFMFLFLCSKESKNLGVNIEMVLRTVFYVGLILLVVYRIIVEDWFDRGDLNLSMKSADCCGKIALNFIESDEQDLKNKEYQEYNKKVNAVHEAGHAVMAYLNKAEIFKVEIYDINPRITWIEKHQDAIAIKRKILISYAGAVAEELMFGFFHFGSLNGYNSDFEKAKDMIKVYIIMIDPSVSKSLLDEELSEQMIFYSKEFWKETKDILIGNKKMLELLSEELFKKCELTGEEIGELLGSIKV